MMQISTSIQAICLTSVVELSRFGLHTHLLVIIEQESQVTNQSRYGAAGGSNVWRLISLFFE